jgi:GlpG protein
LVAFCDANLFALRLDPFGVQQSVDLGLVLVSAVVSNIAQYLVTGPSIFGGMSGVVYALLGFIWTGNWVHPRWLEPVPPALLGFMLVWLFVGLTGALGFLGLGAIANGAHFGGLAIGVICGTCIGLMSRLAKR